MEIEIKYDEEIAVNKKEYIYLVNNFVDSCAFRNNSHNYYFKCWLMKDAPRIAEYLNSVQDQIKYTY